MPVKAPRICGCGFRIASGNRCPCEERQASARKAAFDRTRPSARERGYTSEWEKESKAFLQVNPTCRRCGQPAKLVDHIQAHKGSPGLFWNRSNWQPMCTPCHSRAKQAEEKRNTAR
ncbi:MAG: HNH endonuclease [Beijerinckiaceae bacterium]|nr:HNH endonuclease [Beijerinckiaceae bacterium]